MKNPLLCLTAITSLLIFNNHALAEQPNAGRLADGRAYRVDEQGMRLSDYIAEIEVTNEELRRQVVALEDEIAEANRKLIGRNEKPVNIPACPQVSCPEQECPTQQINNINSMELDKLKRENQAQKDKINQLAFELQRNQTDKENLYQDLINKNKDADDNTESILKNNLTLNQKVNSLEQHIQQLLSSIEDKTEEISHLSRENKSLASKSEDKTSAQNNKLSQLEKKIQEKDYEIAALKSSINSQSQRAALNYSETAKKNNALAETTSDQKTIASYKSELRGQLQKIQNLILQRKNSLDKLKSQNSGVIISIQPLMTKNGISLDKLRLAVDNLQSEDEVSDIKSNLTEISEILSEDIDVIDRLLN